MQIRNGKNHITTIVGTFIEAATKVAMAEESVPKSK